MYSQRCSVQRDTESVLVQLLVYKNEQELQNSAATVAKIAEKIRKVKNTGQEMKQGIYTCTCILCVCVCVCVVLE